MQLVAWIKQYYYLRLFNLSPKLFNLLEFSIFDEMNKFDPLELFE